MKKKLAKARTQDGWSDVYLRHNAAADVLATKALESALPQHRGIHQRAEAQEALDADTIELFYLAGHRSCAARLPKGAGP